MKKISAFIWPFLQDVLERSVNDLIVGLNLDVSSDEMEME